MYYRIVFNFIAFQVGWLACVLGGARGYPWLGTGLALLLIMLHIAWTPQPRRELNLILVVAAIGACWDSMLVAAGWLSYPSGTLIAGTAPHWIVALWMLFATTLNFSLRWLRRRWLLAAMLGGISGPFAYFVGHRLGGVEFSQMEVALFALAVGWAFLTPLVVALAERFDGGHEPLSEPAYT